MRGECAAILLEGACCMALSFWDACPCKGGRRSRFDDICRCRLPEKPVPSLLEGSLDSGGNLAREAVALMDSRWASDTEAALDGAV